MKWYLLILYNNTTSGCLYWTGSTHRDHPVGKVSKSWDLNRTKHRHVQVTSDVWGVGEYTSKYWWSKIGFKPSRLQLTLWSWRRYHRWQGRNLRTPGSLTPYLDNTNTSSWLHCYQWKAVKIRHTIDITFQMSCSMGMPHSHTHRGWLSTLVEPT